MHTVNAKSVRVTLLHSNSQLMKLVRWETFAFAFVAAGMEERVNRQQIAPFNQTNKQV